MHSLARTNDSKRVFVHFAGAHERTSVDDARHVHVSDRALQLSRVEQRPPAAERGRPHAHPAACAERARAQVLVERPAHQRLERKIVEVRVHELAIVAHQVGLGPCGGILAGRAE